MVNLKAEFDEMIKAVKGMDNNEFYKINVLTFEDPIIFGGIDAGNYNRQLYIDIGLSDWEPEHLKALPKWRGLTIKTEYIEKLFSLKNHYYLIIRQEEEQSTEIFDAVLQNLVDHLTSNDSDSLFSMIYTVLDRWRNFFQRGGFRKLSDEQQRGLFGELYFIDEWLEKNPGKPPLVIEQWEGPTKGRIDFKSTHCGFEIKTVSEKLTKTIKISNEDQLKLTKGISTIYLYVCFLEQSKTHGMSLQDIVLQVREKIANRSERIALMFNDMLMDLGFREEEYANVLFFVEKVEVYEADENFPRLLKEDLPKGISHVSYNIDLTHCSEFEKEKELIYKYIN